MKNCTILIVEDEPHIAEVVALKLNQAKLRTVIVRDAREALNLLATRQFDLIIADVAMPGMSGLDLARQIAARGGGDEVPIILLTGMCPGVDRATLTDTHVFDVIPKPFSPKHLLTRVEAALEGLSGGGRVKEAVAGSA